MWLRLLWGWSFLRRRRRRIDTVVTKPVVAIEVLKDDVMIAGAKRAKGFKMSVSSKTFDSLDEKDVKKVTAVK